MTGNYPDLGRSLHQYRISTVIPQMLFCWEASGCIAKCLLFSQSNVCLLSFFYRCLPRTLFIVYYSHVFQYKLFIVYNTCIYCRMLTGAQNTFVYRNMHHGILAVRENIQVLHLTPVCRSAQLFSNF